MEVNTKQVTGRRELHFESLDEIVEDARTLAKGAHKNLGNWSLGQVLKHLAVSAEIAVDGTTLKVPWMFRMMAKMMKKKMLTSKMRAGFKFTEEMKPIFDPPNDTTTEQGLAALESAIERLKGTSDRAPSAAFGQLSAAEYDQLTLRHAELHLSFILPEDG